MKIEFVNDVFKIHGKFLYRKIHGEWHFYSTTTGNWHPSMNTTTAHNLNVFERKLKLEKLL